MRLSRLSELTVIYLRVGNTTMGGGEPAIALLQRELNRRGWLSPEQFGLSYALARLTPGTNMLAFFAAAGWYVLGPLGAFAGVLAATIPSSMVVVLLTRVCEAGDRVLWLGAAVNAAIAAGVGIMVAAAFTLARSQIKKPFSLVPLLIAGGAFGLRQAGLSPLQILILAAAAGLLWRPA